MKAWPTILLRCAACVLAGSTFVCAAGIGQTTAAPAPAAGASTVVRGTVKAADAGSLTVATDAGQSVTVATSAGVRVQQLPAGSTDLKAAQPATLDQVAVGDRVLISARPADAGALVASRVIVMKSGDIAQRNAALQADWRKRGSGGVVTAVDAAAGTLTISAGAKQVTVQTRPTTVIRQYAPGSVKYEDAKPSALADVHTGDQVRIRGDRSADGTNIQAEEMIFGAFRNLAGTVSKVEGGGGTLTLKDRKSGKDVALLIPVNADLRAMPADVAAGMAARSKAKPAADGAETAGARSGAGRGSRGDLSQMMEQFPKLNPAEIKPGQALMVVASGDAGSSSPLTAIVVLSGVDSILAAVPAGGESITLSPWNLGGGGDPAP